MTNDKSLFPIIVLAGLLVSTIVFQANYAIERGDTLLGVLMMGIMLLVFSIVVKLNGNI